MLIGSREVYKAMQVILTLPVEALMAYQRVFQLAVESMKV